MPWLAVALTHRGSVRPSNEDTIAIDGTITTDMPSASRFNLGLEQHCLVLADGMGGHVNGALASRSALDFLITQPPNQFVAAKSCTAMIRAANDHIYDLMQATPDTTAMGTTLVGIVLTTNRLTIFNVGDSRAYLHSPGYLIQLSVDDVPPVAVGASHRRTSHAITQALGGARHRKPINPHVSSMPALAATETVLLCSDGLTDMVDDDTIAEVLDRSNDLCAAVIELNQLAMRAGGRDNISIIAIRAIAA
jgi:serine/threonine protein phosphatase PrpC